MRWKYAILVGVLTAAIASVVACTSTYSDWAYRPMMVSKRLLPLRSGESPYFITAIKIRRWLPGPLVCDIPCDAAVFEAAPPGGDAEVPEGPRDPRVIEMAENRWLVD